MQIKLAAALIALTLSACTSFGPTSEPNYVANATTALPPGAGTVEMIGPGLWAPDANGFAGIMQQAQPVQGSLVISSNGIYFQQWVKPEERYDTIAAIQYTDIAEVRKDEFGRNLRVVLKRKDLSVVSFSFVGAKHQLVDLEKTSQAFDLVSTAIDGGT
jgi:hypothetical protein